MVRTRDFFEDHNSVLQVPVHVIQQEVDVGGLPPWTSLNQSLDGRGYLQEGHSVLILFNDSKWMW